MSSSAYLRHSLIQVTKDRSLNTFPGSGTIDISNRSIGLKENTMVLFEVLFRTFNSHYALLLLSFFFYINVILRHCIAMHFCLYFILK